MKSQQLFYIILSLILFQAQLSFGFDNTNILVEEAVNHIYQGRYQQAHEVLSRAYKQSPRHPRVHFNLGRLFELTGNHEEALKEYRIALALDSSMVAARRGIARAQVELKRLESKRIAAKEREAASESQQIAIKSEHQIHQVRSHQEPPRTISQLPTQETYETKTITEGINMTIPALQAAQEREPTTIHSELAPPSEFLSPEPFKESHQTLSSLQLQQQQTPQTQQRDSLRLPTPRQTSESSLNKAQQLIAEGEVDKAVSALEKHLETNPNSAEALYLLGKAFSTTGDLFPAISKLEESIRVDEKQYNAYYLLGRNYSRVNLLQDALRNYKIYFAVKPQASVALEIARIYEQKNDSSQAREYYARANAMSPGDPALQSRLTESTSNLANDLYLRANHAFTTEKFKEAYNLYSQALATSGLNETYRRDASRKVEISRLRFQEQIARKRPAREGFTTTRHNFATINLKYYQLDDVTFRTRFTGPVKVEWRGYVAKKLSRHGRDFILFIKELSQDELDVMNRSRNDYRLNRHFNNQPAVLVSAPRNGFPSFIKEGTFITFNGTTEWREYEIINDFGQAVSFPAFEFVSAYPANIATY